MPTAENVMNGTYGTVWVNGELWVECDTFEAKVTVNYEDVKFAGDGATHKKGVGWAGDGTMTIKKIYSRVQNAMAANVRKGIYPRFELVGKIADPGGIGTQRAALHDVTIDEFLLMKFDQKTLESEQIPFKFSDYEMLDTVPDPA